MMTLYTAVGRYTTTRTKDGQTDPAVMVNGRKYSLSIHEMLICSSLLGQILTYEELKQEFYEKEREIHILSDLSFDHFLNRLVMRGLIVSGRDVTGVDALYNLLRHLYIRPVRYSLWNKLMTFRHKGLDPTEKKVLHLCHDQLLSTAELMQCLESGKQHLKSHRELMECLYQDDNTDYQNISIPVRFADIHVAVLSAIANLYLKRIILFDTL